MPPSSIGVAIQSLARSLSVMEDHHALQPESILMIPAGGNSDVASDPCQAKLLAVS